MKYMIDTGISIYLINSKPRKVLDHFRKHQPGDIVMSSITLSELKYGVQKSRQLKQNLSALTEFVKLVHVCDYDSAASEEYGIIRSFLESKGKLTGSLDTLIAAHALSLKLTLVTNNLKEFKRVPKLKIENWTR